MKNIFTILFLSISFLSLAQDGALKTVTASVLTTNNYAISEGVPLVYDPKERFIIVFPATNTGAVTIKRASLSPIDLRNADGSTLSASAITANSGYLIRYNYISGYYQFANPGSSGGGGGVSTPTWNTQTGDYTLVISDYSTTSPVNVEMNSASAHNLTVPANASVAFPVGSFIDVYQYGTAQFTVVAAGGVTLNSAAGILTSPNRYAYLRLSKRGTNEWYVENGNTLNASGLTVLGVTGSSAGIVAPMAGIADQILRVNGAASALAFGSIDLSKSATVGSSILPISNGGTGSPTFTGYLLANGGTATGANTFTSTTTNAWTFTTTATAGANNQSPFNVTGTFTARTTAADVAYGHRSTVNVTGGASNQQMLIGFDVSQTLTGGADNTDQAIGLRVAPTYSASGTLGSNNFNAVGAVIIGNPGASTDFVALKLIETDVAKGVRLDFLAHASAVELDNPDAYIITTTGGAQMQLVTPNGYVSIQPAGGTNYQFRQTFMSISSGTRLALGAGTTAQPPMSMVAGTNTTTAVTGYWEYDGTTLFFTRTGTTRESVLTSAGSASAPSTTATPTFTTYYGGNTNALGDPVGWASVVIGGVTRKVPYY